MRRIVLHPVHGVVVQALEVGVLEEDLVGVQPRRVEAGEFAQRERFLADMAPENLLGGARGRPTVRVGQFVSDLDRDNEDVANEPLGVRRSMPRREGLEDQRRSGPILVRQSVIVEGRAWDVGQLHGRIIW